MSQAPSSFLRSTCVWFCRLRHTAYALLAFFLAHGFNSASAAVVVNFATPFEGDSLAKVTVDDQSGSGTIKVTVEVIPNPNIGDLRGVFFHIADESLLTSGTFSAIGPELTSSAYGANSVINLGGGINLNGSGTPGPLDMGFEIGTAGIGSDDIQMTMFTLSHSTANLDVSLFTNEAFGVRMTSVGIPGGARTGSSKLSGSFSIAATTVPEPSSLAALGLCFAAFAVKERRRRRNRKKPLGVCIGT